MRYRLQDIIPNHAVLSYRSGGFFLRDAKSSNGTFRRAHDAATNALACMDVAMPASTPRLLSRIETLEALVATFSKKTTPDKLREDILALIDDKAKFDVTTNNKEDPRTLLLVLHGNSGSTRTARSFEQNTGLQ
ncbi:hypothetical protein GCK32_000495 [Trichostrongylus colubriformis]|uniref:FHA domain-containing protein n=1 Tax=Trichostrongylus colubriformis TaxID=6319 RepID=A0AAN8ERU0_TRICO